MVTRWWSSSGIGLALRGLVGVTGNILGERSCRCVAVGGVSVSDKPLLARGWCGTAGLPWVSSRGLVFVVLVWWRFRREGPLGGWCWSFLSGGGFALGVLSGTDARSYCWVIEADAVAWRVVVLPCASSRGLFDTMLWIFDLMGLFNRSL